MPRQQTAARTPAAHRIMRDLLGRTLCFALLWWIASEGDPRLWWLGALAVLAAVGVSRHFFPPSSRRLRLAALPGFAGYFIWHSLQAGWQVSLLALRGPRALHTGLCQVKTTLPGGAPRLLLVMLVTLMPGTVCIALDDDELLLHVLDRRLPAVDSVAALEARIAALFGRPA